MPRTKSKKSLPAKRNKQAHQVTYPKGVKSLCELSGSNSEAFSETLALQTLGTFWVSPEMTQSQQGKAYTAGLAALQGFQARDTIEGMLAGQMIGLHNAAMESMRRAMLPEQPLECQKHLMAQANKLTRSFTMMLESLNRYRGQPSQQKVTVEHVHVHDGGQAIVGNVEGK